MEDEELRAYMDNVESLFEQALQEFYNSESVRFHHNPRQTHPFHVPTARTMGRCYAECYGAG